MFTLLLFALVLSSPQAAQATTIDRLEASVNSSLILLSDVTKFRETEKLRAQLDPLFSGTALATKGPRASGAEIVDFLIDEKLISQQFAVSDSEVEQEINTIQSNNRIDRTTLKNALAEQGFAFGDYFELIRTSTSKRNLIDRDIRTKVTISDDDVKNFFYNKYARSSSAPLSYSLKIISIPIRNYKSAAAAKEVAQRALADLRAGEAFEEVAKRMGDQESGGDLGTVTEDQMSPAIREQVKTLKIGQVSEIFGGPSTGAYSLIKLLDVKSGDTERFNKLKDEIRNQLAASEYQHQISLWLERQRQIAFIHKSGS